MEAIISIYSINLILTLSSDIEMAVNIPEIEKVAFTLVSNIAFFFSRAVITYLVSKLVSTCSGSMICLYLSTQLLQ